MNVRKNFVYSATLTASNYIFPLIVFPYVSRVLGVTNIGICNFVDSIVNYFILFSMMGMNILGIRVIASNKEDKVRLNQVFSNLFTISLIATLVVLVVYAIAIFTVPKLSEYREMLYIGGLKLLFNVFLIEWFYKGLENFKYITARSIFTKILYVILIFVFVKNVDDYNIYYLLTCGITIINSIINWNYSRNFIRFSLRNVEIKPYLKSFIILGSYLLLTSMYTTFNISYLGFVANDTQVGYYSTATKLYTIILAIFTAFTGVMLPRMSTLVSQKKFDEVRNMTNKSFDILLMICFPLMTIAIVFAPEIVEIISGNGYQGAIVPMRIVMPLVLVIGLEQILIVQLLMPMEDDKAVFRNSLIGAGVGLLGNIILVSKFQSVGSSIVWVLSEIAVLISASIFVYRKLGIIIPFRKVLWNLILAVPYIVLALVINYLTMLDVFKLALAGVLFFGYFVIVNYFILKNEILVKIIHQFKSRFDF